MNIVFSFESIDTCGTTN